MARSDHHCAITSKHPISNPRSLSVPVHPVPAAMSQLLLQSPDTPSSSDDDPELTYINLAIALSFIVVDSPPFQSRLADGSYFLCCARVGNREVCSCCFGTMFNTVICDGILHPIPGLDLARYFSCWGGVIQFGHHSSFFVFVENMACWGQTTNSRDWY